MLINLCVWYLNFRKCAVITNMKIISNELYTDKERIILNNTSGANIHVIKHLNKL